MEIRKQDLAVAAVLVAAVLTSISVAVVRRRQRAGFVECSRPLDQPLNVLATPFVPLI